MKSLEEECGHRGAVGNDNWESTKQSRDSIEKIFTTGLEAYQGGVPPILAKVEMVATNEK